MEITVKQLQRVLREMGLFNFAEASVEDDPKLFEIWKKPAHILNREDPLVEAWRKKIGISTDAVTDFFKKAMNK